MADGRSFSRRVNFVTDSRGMGSRAAFRLGCHSVGFITSLSVILPSLLPDDEVESVSFKKLYSAGINKLFCI